MSEMRIRDIDDDKYREFQRVCFEHKVDYAPTVKAWIEDAKAVKTWLDEERGKS